MEKNQGRGVIKRRVYRVLVEFSFPQNLPIEVIRFGRFYNAVIIKGVVVLAFERVGRDIYSLTPNKGVLIIPEEGKSALECFEMTTFWTRVFFDRVGSPETRYIRITRTNAPINEVYFTINILSK